MLSPDRAAAAWAAATTVARSSARRTLTAIPLVVVATAACGAPPASPPAATPSPPRPPAVPPSTVDAAADVRAAVATYVSLLHAYTAASNSGTDDTTQLAKYATGPARDVLARGLADNKANGRHSQGAPGIDPPTVTSVAPASAPTTVSLAGCVDDTRWQLYTSSGQLADTSPGGRRGTTARVDKRDGTWLVTGLAIQGVRTCPG